VTRKKLDIQRHLSAIVGYSHGGTLMVLKPPIPPATRVLIECAQHISKVIQIAQSSPRCALVLFFLLAMNLRTTAIVASVGRIAATHANEVLTNEAPAP
jgi:hypothetical protein